MGQQLYLVALGLLMLCFPVQALAAELNNQTPLAAEQVLDETGKPLPIPSQFEAALEYRAEPPSATNKPTSKTKSRSKGSSTSTVADDPGCRWLQQRIKDLQQRIANPSYIETHLKQELSQHQQRWRCLDCAGAGPRSGDHARCGK